MKLFINARTDVFFEHGDDAAQAVRRSARQSQGLCGRRRVRLLRSRPDGRCADRADLEGTPLPVNVMVMDGVPSNDSSAELGVARISYGPIPYIRAMKTLEQEAKTMLSGAAARSEG